MMYRFKFRGPSLVPYALICGYGLFAIAAPTRPVAPTETEEAMPLITEQADADRNELASGLADAGKLSIVETETR